MTVHVHQILILIDDSDISSFIPNSSQTVKDFCSNFLEKEDEVVYKVWSNSEIRTLLKDSFEPEVLEAYDSVVPGSYKADLAKYCLLYKFGGWYVDMNTEIVDVPPSFYNEYDLILFTEDFRGSGVPYGVIVGLMYSKNTSHQVFKNAIDITVNNIKNKTYGINPLAITSTIVLGEAVAQYGSKEGLANRYLIGDFSYSPEEQRHLYLWSDGKLFAKNKSHARPNSGGDPFIKKTNNYNVYWETRSVYGEFDPGEKALSSEGK
jgi:mannosyltransferase OCH1-like enzyme